MVACQRMHRAPETFLCLDVRRGRGRGPWRPGKAMLVTAPLDGWLERCRGPGPEGSGVTVG